MLDAVKFATRIIGKRPLRSLLTILQLALGVWIVSIVLSLSFNARYEDPIAKSLSDSLVQLQLLKEERTDDHIMAVFMDNFQLEDAARLEREGLHIQRAFVYSPAWQLEIESGGVSYQVRVAAEVTPQAFPALGMELVAGSFFTQSDVDQGNPVAVISQTIAGQLFPDESPVGKTIKLKQYDHREVTIIGVYQPLSASLEGFLEESFLIFPAGILRPSGLLPGWGTQYHSLLVQALPGHISEAVEEARVILADRGQDGVELRAQSFAELRGYTQDSIGTVTKFLGAVAFVAVAISSIGILSIMLVNVVERTREMGLRRALGASRLQIVGQVLSEAFVYSLLGAIVGIGAALVTSQAVSERLLAQMYYFAFPNLGALNVQAVLVTVFITAASGQLFALYPAIQAARITPVDALRDH